MGAHGYIRTTSDVDFLVREEPFEHHRLIMTFKAGLAKVERKVMKKDDIIGEITQIERIARGTSLHVRKSLNKRHGRGKWRKLKGVALVKDNRGNVRWAEIHWYEAHGIGKKDFKRKRWLED